MDASSAQTSFLASYLLLCARCHETSNCIFTWNRWFPVNWGRFFNIHKRADTFQVTTACDEKQHILFNLFHQNNHTTKPKIVLNDVFHHMDQAHVALLKNINHTVLHFTDPNKYLMRKATVCSLLLSFTSSVWSATKHVQMLQAPSVWHSDTLAIL